MIHFTVFNILIKIKFIYKYIYIYISILNTKYYICPYLYFHHINNSNNLLLHNFNFNYTII